MKRTSNQAGLLATVMATMVALTMFATPALAQDPNFNTFFNGFQNGLGDGYSNLFLAHIFGPLFNNPLTGQAGAHTILSIIVPYFNYIALAIMTMLLLYNGTVGVAQSAHEGKLLGQRWSSLWAPLRVLFAYTLVVPIPTIGYNLGQVFVAWIVKGGTWFASWIWATAIALFAGGVVPITPPMQKIAPESVQSMFLNAACVAIKNQQEVDSQTDKRWVLFDAGHLRNSLSSADRNRVVGSTYPSFARVGDNGRIYNEGHCGEFSTPNTPLYLQQRSQGVTILADGTEASVETMFANGHRQIATKFATDINTVVMNNHAAIADPQSPMPVQQVRQGIYNAMITANEELETLNKTLLDSAVGVNDVAGQAAREALIARVTGDCNFTGADPSVASSCFGEGWIGAGAWYMTVASLNSEVSSLMGVSLTVTDQDSISASSRNDVLSNDRTLSMGGNLDGNAATQLARQSEYMMARYHETFVQASTALAAFGFTISTDNIKAMTQFGEVPAERSWWDFLGKLNDKIIEYSAGFLQYLNIADMNADPMVSIVNLGHLMIDVASGIMAVDTLFNSINVWMVTVPILACGVLLSFVLPMLPFILWVLGVTGYLLLVVEAIIAINLWAISHMRLDGEGVSGEAGRTGWLMLLALALTPALMIIGFLAGMIIFRTTVLMINAGMGPLAASLIGSSVVATVFGTVSIFMMTCAFYIFALERSFSLISTMSGSVLRWIGANAELNANELQRGRAIAATGTGMITGAVRSIGGGIKKAGSSSGGGGASAGQG